MSNIFENMMNSYEESHKPSVSNAKKYDLKNYFSTYLKEGVNSATKVIRLLPPQNGRNLPWVIKWGHKVKLDGDWKTYACLDEEEGKPCPFCEAREALMATRTESDKQLAKKYSKRKMYVVKVIDREKPEEGVKFWRFNHDYRKTGIMDKMISAIKAVNHDISDPVTGRDLNISIARDMNNVPVVQSISYPLESTPLHSDTEVATEWLSDERTWRDVYSLRDYDYLSIIVGGDVPVYDKVKDKFVGRSKMEKEKAEAEANKVEENFDSELTMGGQPTTTQPTQPQVTNVTMDDDDDDLPF